MEGSNKENLINIDLKVYLNYVLRYWYLIPLGLALGISYAFFQVRYTPPSYTTDARMLVKDEYSSWGQEYFLPGMELVSSRNRLVNEIGVIKSLPLMERVANELSWDVSYYKIGDIKTTEMYPNSEFYIDYHQLPQFGSVYISFESANTFRLAASKDSLEESPIYNVDREVNFKGSKFKLTNLSSEVNTDVHYRITVNHDEAWARYFQRTLNISPEQQESSILILTQQNQNPQRSIDFLNQLMRTYIDWGVEQNNLTASNTISFVDNQLKVIADSLVKTEYRLENFQKESFKDRIYVGDTEFQEGQVSNIAEVVRLEEQLTQRAIQREYYSALMKTLKQKDFTAFPSSAIFGFADANIDEMTSNLMSEVINLKEKGSSLKEGSTYYDKLLERVEERKNDLYESALTNQKQVDKLIDSLQKQINLEELKVMQIPQEQREYFNLKREFKLLSDLYTFLLNKRSEASIAKASNNPKAQILDFADDYRVNYTGPKSSSIYFSSILLSLLIPLAVILIIYLLNNKVVNTTDIEHATKIPILGSIGFKKGLDSNLVVSNNLKSIVAESYRSIRTNLNFMTEGKEKVKILVTSSISGEGKTFNSINLAAIYAASGKRTVLIGADLRKPKIFNDFGLTNEKGMSTYLIGKANLRDVIQDTEVDNLDLVSSGPIPPNPAELIESTKMQELMEELEKIYDVVIIDSPPLGLVTDALLLKKYADAGIYIVRHNYTKKLHLRNVNQLYEEGVISKIGLVVNAVRQKKGMSTYGYGTYGYGSYGYGYGYGGSYGYGYYSEDK